MDREEYLRGVASLYAAEVLGEDWRPLVELCSDREQKYNLSLFLQLESEAKGPTATAAGPIRPESRGGSGTASCRCFRGRAFAAVPWREAMATLAELALPYVHRFQALLDVAPPRTCR